MSTALLPGDPPVEITLRRSARTRRISLRVSALDGRVTLSLPKNTPVEEALEFARHKSGWIRRHLQSHEAPVEVTTGSEVPFEGVNLVVTEASVRRARREGQALLIPTGKAMAAARVKAFLKLEARQRLTEHSARYARILDRRIGRITLRDTRSRWGSCTAAGNLMYSWRLVMAPPDVLDYVAAHEVAHLVEMNHSAAYWDVVARICPEFQAHRTWLRKNGAALHRYRFDD